MSCKGTCSPHDHVGTRRVHQWLHHDSTVHLFCCSSLGQCDLRNPRRSSNQPSQRDESIQQIDDKSAWQTSHGRGCNHRGGSVKDGVKLREITGYRKMMHTFRGRESNLWVIWENIICSLNLLRFSRLFSPATSTPSSSSTSPASHPPTQCLLLALMGGNKGWEVFIDSIELVFCITKEWNSIACYYPWNPATCGLFYLEARRKEEKWFVSLERGDGRRGQTRIQKIWGWMSRRIQLHYWWHQTAAGFGKAWCSAMSACHVTLIDPVPSVALRPPQSVHFSLPHDLFTATLDWTLGWFRFICGHAEDTFAVEYLEEYGREHNVHHIFKE